LEGFQAVMIEIGKVYKYHYSWSNDKEAVFVVLAEDNVPYGASPQYGFKILILYENLFSSKENAISFIAYGSSMYEDSIEL
jgi:hypothetical protein